MKTIRIIPVALVAVLALAGGAGSAAHAGDATSLAQFGGVNFVSACGFSHRAADDPIVFPGRPGESHDHSFVGNRTTSATSTAASLLAGSSTCRRAGETAAYWMPTLFENGQPVTPLGATIYYRRRSIERVRPFPLGFRMIAGDAHATAPQDRHITFWNCGGLAGLPPSSTLPTCPGTQRDALRLHVSFPSCWNGKNLDSRDHQSHMAYALRGRCPASHPVAVPAISLIFRYAVKGPGVELASGGQFSGHADFFNAWRPATLRELVDGCLNAWQHCGRAGPMSLPTR